MADANDPINKTMDRADLARTECEQIIRELADLKRRMREVGVMHSSWYGRIDGSPSLWDRANRGMSYEPLAGWDDDDRVPWFLLWEISWLVSHTSLKPGQCVLDLGGASSLFSCYLADRGCRVISVDLDDGLVRHAGRIAAAMGWPMEAIRADMAEVDLPAESIDHIFSVCVLEHLPWQRRRIAAGLWKRLLKPGGTVGLTFDYRSPHCDVRLDSPADLMEQLVEPSGLSLRGNRDFVDHGQSYLESAHYFGFGRLSQTVSMLSAFLHGYIRAHRLALRHRHYTFGAIFMEKGTAPS